MCTSLFSVGVCVCVGHSSPYHDAQCLAYSSIIYSTLSKKQTHSGRSTAVKSSKVASQGCLSLGESYT